MPKVSRAVSSFIVVTLAFTTLSMISLPAKATPITGGSLNLLYESNYGADSWPDQLLVVDETLYFLAETRANGWELYSQTDGETTLHDLAPGPASSAINWLFPIDGGVGFHIDQDSNFFDNYGYSVGLHRDGVTTWLHDEDFDYGINTDFGVEANGHLIMVNGEDKFLLVDPEVGFGFIDSEINASIETSEWVFESNSVSSSVSPASDIFAIRELTSIGPYLVAEILVVDGRWDLYYLDTRAEIESWQWQAVVTDIPTYFNLGDSETYSEDIDHFRVSGDSLYVFFDYEIQKFTLDENEVLRADDVAPGVRRWQWENDEENYFETVAVLNNQVFFQGDEDFELYWLSPEGEAVVAGDSAGDLADDFDLLLSAELDGVLYFYSQGNLIAWEYETGLIYLAFESLNPYSQPFNPRSDPNVASLGKSIFATSVTTAGIEIVEIDTLRDTAEIIEVDSLPGYSNVVDVETFGDSVYFFDYSPESNDVAYLLREVDGEVTGVTDDQGNLLRVGLHYPVEFPNVLQKTADGKLYALAFDNASMSPIGIGEDRDIALWEIDLEGEATKVLGDDGLGMEDNFGAAANLIYNPSVSAEIFIAIQNWDSPTLWRYSQSAEVFAEIDTLGTSFYGENTQTLMGMGGELFTTTGVVNNGPTSFSKIVRLDLAQGRVEPVTYTNGLNSTYDADEYDAVWFKKILHDPTADIYFALLSDYKGADAAGKEFGVAVIDWSGGSVNLNVIVEGFMTTDEVEIIDSFYVEEGPGEAPHLLVQFWDMTTGPDLGRMAYVPISSLPSPQSPLQLSRSFQAVLEDGGYEIDVLPIPSIYDPISNLMFVSNMGDGFHTYQVFSGQDFSSSETLAGAEELWESGYFESNRYLYLQRNMPIAHQGSKLFFPVQHRDWDGSALFEYDPFAAPDFEPLDPLASISDNFYRELQPRVPFRPLEAEANVSLKSNYDGGPADVVLRGAGRVVLDGSVFTRPGFELAGWADSPWGSASIGPNDSFDFYSSTWLYAVWRQVSVTVSVPVPVPVPVPVEVKPGASEVKFAVPASVVGLATQTVAPGGVIELPEVSLAGYKFEGWTEGGSGPVFSGAYRPAGAVVLQPTFSPITVKVFLAPVQGVELPTSIDFTSGETLVLPIPSLDGHTFVGWTEAGTGLRITKGWRPTEATMLIPEFRVGGPDHTVSFWQSSSVVSTKQLTLLNGFASVAPGLERYRTIVITGFDSKNPALAKKRALNVAIKLRKLGYQNKIELESVVRPGVKPTAQLVGLLEG